MSRVQALEEKVSALETQRDTLTEEKNALVDEMTKLVQRIEALEAAVYSPAIPGEVGDLEAARNGSTVTLTWTAPVEDAEAVHEYLIRTRRPRERFTDAGNTLGVVGADMLTDAVAWDPGIHTWQVYEVIAVNSEGVHGPAMRVTVR